LGFRVRVRARVRVRTGARVMEPPAHQTSSALSVSSTLADAMRGVRSP